jgi:hypothetical protein
MQKEVGPFDAGLISFVRKDVLRQHERLHMQRDQEATKSPSPVKEAYDRAPVSRYARPFDPATPPYELSPPLDPYYSEQHVSPFTDLNLLNPMIWPSGGMDPIGTEPDWLEALLGSDVVAVSTMTT